MPLCPKKKRPRFKEAKKKFQKAKPEAQVQFIQELKAIEENRSDNAVTVDIDEVHLYLEADLRQMWGYKGKETVVVTSSPGRKKINYYGAVIPELGKVILMETKTFNQESSAEFLKKVRERLPGRRIDLVWDGGPQHKGEKVREAFKKYNIREHKLPGYSPELSRIEPLWRWMRQRITYNYCHDKENQLRMNIQEELGKIREDKKAMLRRLKRNTSKIKHLLKQANASSGKA